MLVDTIFTVVSSPGPAESAVVREFVPDFQERVRVGSEVRLRVLVGGNEASATTLLFLHGRGHAAPIWAHQLRALSERFRVLAIDLPGFGHSAHRELSAQTMSASLGFFVDPIEEIVREEKAVILVGHSLGGLVSLELARRLPQCVKGMVLLAAMGMGPEVLTAARLYLRVGPERMARASKLLGLSGRGLSGSRPMNDKLTLMRSELLLSHHGRAAKQAFDNLVPIFGPAFSLSHALPELQTPTLLVAGEHDDAFPLPIFMRAAARMPHAELRVLPTGHSPHLELPDLVNSLIEAFASKHSSEA